MVKFLVHSRSQLLAFGGQFKFELSQTAAKQLPFNLIGRAERRIGSRFSNSCRSNSCATTDAQNDSASFVLFCLCCSFWFSILIIAPPDNWPHLSFLTYVSLGPNSSQLLAHFNGQKVAGKKLRLKRARKLVPQVLYSDFGVAIKQIAHKVSLFQPIYSHQLLVHRPQISSPRRLYLL